MKSDGKRKSNTLLRIINQWGTQLRDKNEVINKNKMVVTEHGTKIHGTSDVEKKMHIFFIFI